MFWLIVSYIFEAIAGIFFVGSGAVIIYMINLFEKTHRDDISGANRRDESDEFHQFRVKYAQEDLEHLLKNKPTGIAIGCIALIIGVLLITHLVYRLFS